uniref:Ovule protein n=1 Tax=Steinernema glaseri TaxID=37863 RepID=A0A1I8AV36_9BILA
EKRPSLTLELVLPPVLTPPLENLPWIRVLLDWTSLRRIPFPKPPPIPRFCFQAPPPSIPTAPSSCLTHQFWVERSVHAMINH